MKEYRRSESESVQLGWAQQPSKRPRLSNSETSIDGISLLPDSILQHILSFLAVQDFIKTSVLSKRWRSVWATVPILRFYYITDESTPHFERFITKTLANYRGNKVEKLDISFPYESSLNWQVDEWIRFATERKVEELNLFPFPKDGDCLDVYYLHQSIYSNSSLKILHTKCFNLKPSVSVSWTSLRVLSIYFAKFSNDCLARILLGSPNLKSLKLRLFAGVDKIMVTSSNMKLKELLLEYWLLSPSTALEISAPHIHSLSLAGFTLTRMIKLTNLSSLMEFNLDLDGADYEVLTGLVGELHRVPKLRVSSRFLQLLSKCQMRILALPLPLNCKSLIVDSSIKKWDFHRIVALLQATPYLSQLGIAMDHSSLHMFGNGIVYWESLKTEVKCDHLTTIFITGFDQSWCVGSRLKFFTSVVEFLLKNATVLERMVIYAQPELTAESEEMAESDKTNKLPDLSEVKELISSYPRASVVVFKTYLD